MCACESLIFLYFRSQAAYFKVSQFLRERSKVSRRKTSAALTLVHVDIPYIPYMHTLIANYSCCKCVHVSLTPPTHLPHTFNPSQAHQPPLPLLPHPCSYRWHQVCKADSKAQEEQCEGSNEGARCCAQRSPPE